MYRYDSGGSPAVQLAVGPLQNASELKYFGSFKNVHLLCGSTDNTKSIFCTAYTNVQGGNGFVADDASNLALYSLSNITAGDYIVKTIGNTGVMCIANRAVSPIQAGCNIFWAGANKGAP